MKSVFKLLFIIIILGSAHKAEAQLFKGLKNKVKKQIDRKTEDKIEEVINNTIDSLDVKRPKKTKDTVESKEGFGTILLNHSQKFGAVSIEGISRVKVIKSNDGYQMTGNWWSHEADIFDGFNLIIKTAQNLKHEENNKKLNSRQVFKIPEEATLTLGYDPQLLIKDTTPDDYKAAVSDDYQNYDVSTGEVSIDVLTDDSIQISFSGKVSLRTMSRNSSNSEHDEESYFESNLKGAIDGNSPKFIDNTSLKKPESAEQNSGNYTIPQSSTSTAQPGVYEFTHETVVKMTNLDKNEVYKMSYLFNPNESYLGIKADMSEYSDEEMAGESIMVMDDQDIRIFVSTQGMKMQMSQSMMGGNQTPNPADQMANYDYTKIDRTGRTKTILGAVCEEYVMSDSEVKMELWVASSVQLPNWFIPNKEIINGHIMEYTVTSKEGNMKAETTAIKDNINTIINSKEYKKMF